MMRAILLAVAAAVLSGCAIVDYEKFEGANQAQVGSGGTKTVVEGVDIWNYGAPPRPYRILGMATATIANGPAGPSMIRSSIANKVKEAGGNAAINVDTIDSGGGAAIGQSFGAGGGYATSTAVLIGRITARYLIVRYED